jgi:hypothetical protein
VWGENVLKRITGKQIDELIKSRKPVKFVCIVSNGDKPQDDLPYKAITIYKSKLEQLAETVFCKNDIIVLYADEKNWETSVEVAERLDELGFPNVMEYRSCSKGYEEIDFTM